MQRVDRLLELHFALHGKRGRPQQQVSDLLRGTAVLAAGALDGLLLEVIVEGVPHAARLGRLGPTVEKWIDDSPKVAVEAFAKQDPAEHLATLARDKLSRTTFQKPAMIESNLRDILTVPAPWASAAQRLTNQTGETWSAERVKDVLDDFMQRRDRIAHSGDQKPNSAGAMPIQRSWVEDGQVVIWAVGEVIVEQVEAHLS